MIEKQVTFEGVLREEEEQSNVTAFVQDYRMAAITKDAAYSLVDALPYDFLTVAVTMRITEAFDGTIDLGTDANHSRILGDASFRKTVGKKAVPVTVLMDAGQQIKLFLGPGTTGKIEVHLTGVLQMPSLL